MENIRSRERTIKINDQLVRCVPIGVLAAILGRTPHTLRAWERSGLLPRPIILRPNNPRSSRRYYPTSFVRAIQDVAVKQQFGRRRPSNRFPLQQAEIIRAWNATTASLIPPNQRIIRTGRM